MEGANLLRDINKSELARGLSIDRSTVSKWISRNRIPSDRVLAVEAITGLSRHDLRPDLYPLDSGRDGV